MPQAEPFVISRVFGAPKALVFEVHTTPEHLRHWLSPAGFINIYTSLDFRSGGHYHYGLQAPDGSQMWGMQRYQEIVPNERITLIQSFSDKDGGVTRHPMADTWPLEMLATTTFESVDDTHTKVTVSWQPHNADDIGNATFDAARDGMTNGFSGTFAKLDEYLATLTA